MGEPVEVPQTDLGKVGIDATKVVLPVEETITGLVIEKTKDGKWSRFEIPTTERRVAVEPGIIGQAEFNELCTEVAAMFATVEGAAVITKLQALVGARGLEAKTVIAEVPSE